MRPNPFLRVTSAGLLVCYVNLALPIAPLLWAAEPEVPPITLDLAPLPRDWMGKPPLRPPAEFLEPVRTPAHVAINRAVPAAPVGERRLQFSADTTSDEIIRAQVFREPLQPLGTNFAPGELRALAKAIQAYDGRSAKDDVSSLTEFLGAYPGSPWRVSLLTNLGLDYFDGGYFSKALESWEDALRLAREGKAPKSRKVAGRALAELLQLGARIGRTSRLAELVADSKDLEVEGAVYEKIRSAREGLEVMRARPDIAFKCGPYAVGSVLAALGKDGAETMNKVRAFPSTAEGTSLKQVAALARDVGLGYQIMKRAPGSAIPLPAVIHWKVGHFGALVAEVSPGRYLVKDPTFQLELVVSREAIDQEASGYFLVPAQTDSPGWTGVEETEAGKVFGRGYAASRTANAVRRTDTAVKVCPPPPRAMPDYNVHALLTSLTINDIPLGYTPPVGPAIDFQITHIQRDSLLTGLSSFGNMGDRWTHNWLSFVLIDSGSATVFMRGGGGETYTGFSGNQYQLQTESRCILAQVVQGGVTAYERRAPDGSKHIFAEPVGGNRYFLSQVVDPFGHTVTINYDASTHRILSIDDALGQRTNFAYENADSQKITKVTDPYGRVARFTYTSNGFLENVTDVAGLRTQFTYETATTRKYMLTMTTPYGATNFTYSPESEALNTWIEVQDPQGAKERTEFFAPQTTNEFEAASLSGIANSESNAPSSAAVENRYLGYRNSFYWDKKAYALGYPDRNKAVIYHWLHTGPGTTVASPILESMKRPGESRVWFRYFGQAADKPTEISSGMQGSPSRVMQMVPDETGTIVERHWVYEYNDLGRVTKAVDPIGRETVFEYATNLQDLRYIKQKNGTGYDTLASFTYGGTDPAPHLPTKVTDAAGQDTVLAYHPNGQLKTVTNAKNELTTLSYDPLGTSAATGTGYLVAVDGPLANDTVTLAYDALRRPRTFTDTDSYAVTTDYDNLDRPTVITYPDGTFEQLAYPRVEAEWMRDRLGRWTQVGYNSLRQVSFVQDAMQRVTSYEWCYCGALQKLTDPMGRVTQWNYDFSGRLQWKKYPGAASNSLAYTYDQAGRLKDVTDALNQTTTYKYFKDGAVALVDYSNEVNATPDVSYTYDPVYPRLASVKVGSGINDPVTSYGYHPYSQTEPAANQPGAGQLASVDGPFGNDIVAYTYDELGRTLTRTINAAANSTVLRYDAAGRVDQIVNPLGTFGFGYVNATDRLDYVNYPNAQRTNYTYWPNTTATPGAGNGDRRLQQIQNLKTAGGVNLSTFAYTYDPVGVISTWQQQAGTNPSQTYTFGYDPADQLVTALLRNTTTGTSLHANTYAYDDAGNRTSDLADATPRTFTINNLNQIGSQSAGGPVRFSGTLSKPGTATVNGAPATMDTTTRFSASPVLNPGVQNVPVTATDTSGNVRNQTYALAVGNAGSRTFAYDANGNMTNNGAGQTYAWDAADRLIKITYTGGATTEFVYNGASQRVKIIEKASGGTVTSEKRFVWADEPQPCEERDASDNVTKRFYSGLGQLIGSTKYFYTTDHLGSIRELTDSSGTVRARYDYDPYGRTTKTSGDLESDFGFTGFYRHQTSGLNLTHYRAYDSDLGRWINRDPITEEGGLNLYRYANNGPIEWIDRDGRYAAVYVVGRWSAGQVFVAGLGLALMLDAMRQESLTRQAWLEMQQRMAQIEINRSSGLITHVDNHIQKVMDVCPSGSPDPEDPNQDPVKGWIREIKAGIKNLQRELKKMPNNKTKRDPIEQAIQRAQDALSKWGQE